jgi:hypothetical protein
MEDTKQVIHVVIPLPEVDTQPVKTLPEELTSVSTVLCTEPVLNAPTPATPRTRAARKEALKRSMRRSYKYSTSNYPVKKLVDHPTIFTPTTEQQKRPIIRKTHKTKKKHCSVQ